MARLPYRFGYFSDTDKESVYTPGNYWDVEGGKLFVLREEPFAELLTWLQANATRYFADEVGK